MKVSQALHFIALAAHINAHRVEDEIALNEERNLRPACRELPTFPETADVETVLSFYAFGDTPYSLGQQYCLNRQLRELNMTNGAALFAVHVGDIKKASKQIPCEYSTFNDIAKMHYHPNNAVSYDPRDTFFVVGDNEWVDCKDPDEAWALWTEHFGANNRFGYGTFSPGKNIRVERQTNTFRMPGIDRSENFAFFVKDILFIGLNIVGGDAYGDERIRLVQNLDWTRQKMALYKTQGMKACVVFGHAAIHTPTGDRKLYFGDNFFHLLRTEYSDMQVMYIHGDWHDYCIRRMDKLNKNFYDLELDGGGFAPPVLVSVLRNNNPNDDRYLFKVDTRGGRYKYTPDGTCNKIYEVTWGEGAPEPDQSSPGPTVSVSTQPPTAPPTQPPTPSSTGNPELYTYPRYEEPYPLGECEGDCNMDNHCQPGLKCFKRDDLSPVPGCSGLGKNRKDYCIVPPANELTFVGKKKLNPELFPLDQCKGYCYRDDHCKEGLKCFFREEYEEVPGCTGSGRFGKNYCYDDTE